MGCMKGVPALDASDVCVAQQPIFDAELRVVAYELLYRAEARDAQAHVVDGVAATSRVVVGSVAEIGLENLSGDRVIHLNLPRELDKAHAAVHRCRSRCQDQDRSNAPRARIRSARSDRTDCRFSAVTGLTKW